MLQHLKRYARQKWVDRSYRVKDLEGYDRANSIAQCESLDAIIDEIPGVGEIRALADGDFVDFALA